MDSAVHAIIMAFSIFIFIFALNKTLYRLRLQQLVLRGTDDEEF